MTTRILKDNASAALIQCSIFVLMTCITIFTVGFVIEKIAMQVDTSYPQAVAAVSLNDQDFDVVFLGDSTTSQSVNPKIALQGTGLTGYNLASPGANYISMLGSLKHYIDHNQKPRMVAIGTYVNKGDGDTGISSDLFLDFDAENKQLVDTLLRKYGDDSIDYKFELMNSVPAYRLRDSIESAVKVVIQGEQRIPEFVYGHLALSVRLQEPAPVPAEFPAGFKLGMLEELLAYCREQSIPVVLFEPPGSPGFNAAVNGRETVLNEIRALVANGEAINFHSFNDVKKYPFKTDEWVNLNHFNRYGAARFSSESLGPWVAAELGSLENKNFRESSSKMLSSLVEPGAAKFR